MAAGHLARGRTDSHRVASCRRHCRLGARSFARRRMARPRAQRAHCASTARSRRSCPALVPRRRSERRPGRCAPRGGRPEGPRAAPSGARGGGRVAGRPRRPGWYEYDSPGSRGRAASRPPRHITDSGEAAQGTTDLAWSPEPAPPPANPFVFSRDYEARTRGMTAPRLARRDGPFRALCSS